jgi:biopolymer transport protein ExbD
MRFKNRSRQSQFPEVNLVPMMDVLMTVLTFFIIISMTLRGQQLAKVQLPQTDGTGGENIDTTAENITLVVGLNAENELSLRGQPVTPEELTPQIRDFLLENPQGTVLLKADRGLTFSDVTSVLKTMRDVGGNRVSLAFDRGREKN